MKSVIKSSAFDTFDIENAVADVLHASNSSFSELSSCVSSDFNSEVMPFLVSYVLFIVVCMCTFVSLVLFSVRVD